eukprot:PhM_4_TR5655/c0_g1_i1/m.11683
MVVYVSELNHSFGFGSSVERFAPPEERQERLIKHGVVQRALPSAITTDRAVTPSYLLESVNTSDGRTTTPLSFISASGSELRRYKVPALRHAVGGECDPTRAMTVPRVPPYPDDLADTHLKSVPKTLQRFIQFKIREERDATRMLSRPSSSFTKPCVPGISEIPPPRPYSVIDTEAERQRKVFSRPSSSFVTGKVSSPVRARDARTLWMDLDLYTEKGHMHGSSVTDVRPKNPNLSYRVYSDGLDSSPQKVPSRRDYELALLLHERTDKTPSLHQAKQKRFAASQSRKFAAQVRRAMSPEKMVPQLMITQTKSFS